MFYVRKIFVIVMLLYGFGVPLYYTWKNYKELRMHAAIGNYFIPFGDSIRHRNPNDSNKENWFWFVRDPLTIFLGAAALLLMSYTMIFYIW